jgi:outer membrane murein-binding lipoprotein Lpp
MKILTISAALLMLCTFGLAQSKPADPPAKIPVTLESRDPLRAAIHKQDQVQKQISDLTAQFVQMQNQATTKMQTLQAQEKQTEADIEAAKLKAYAAAKLDPAKYDLDLDTMEFSTKTASEAKK